MHVFLISRADESVTDNTADFIVPKSDKLLGCLEPVRSAQTQAIVNPAQVSQVEDVMELARSRWHVSDYLLIKLHCSPS